MDDKRPADTVEELSKGDYEELARFRFQLRKFLRFSEEAIRRYGLSPQQYLLLLQIKGFPGRDWATIGELAERLQLRHHSVVELVDRGQRLGHVERQPHPDDRRAVKVTLTAQGEELVRQLASIHQTELRRVGDLLHPPARDPAASPPDASNS